MKVLLAAVIILSSTITHANDFAGQFTLGKDPQEFAGSSKCAIRTRLNLDEAQLMGKIALLTDYVEGFCEIAVNPNQRFVQLTNVGTECGSQIYQGNSYSADGQVLSVKVIDHRNRTCRDLVPSRIIVEIDQMSETEVLYALQKATSVSCMAIGACDARPLKPIFAN